MFVHSTNLTHSHWIIIRKEAFVASDACTFPSEFPCGFIPHLTSCLWPGTCLSWPNWDKTASNKGVCGIVRITKLTSCGWQNDRWKYPSYYYNTIGGPKYHEILMHNEYDRALWFIGIVRHLGGNKQTSKACETLLLYCALVMWGTFPSIILPSTTC